MSGGLPALRLLRVAAADLDGLDRPDAVPSLNLGYFTLGRPVLFEDAEPAAGAGEKDVSDLPPAGRLADDETGRVGCLAVLEEEQVAESQSPQSAALDRSL